MSIGFLFLYGNGLLVFRLFKQQQASRQTIKLTHAVINGAAGVFAILGLIVVFVYHIGPGFSNLYSLHSWIGLFTVILYVVNFILGLVISFVPQTPGWIRSLFMPYHIFAGIALIALIVVSFISGLVEKSLFVSYGEGVTYSDLPSQAVIINILGMIILAFGLLAGFLVTQRT